MFIVSTTYRLAYDFSYLGQTCRAVIRVERDFPCIALAQIKFNHFCSRYRHESIRIFIELSIDRFLFFYSQNDDELHDNKVEKSDVDKDSNKSWMKVKYNISIEYLE